LLALGACAITLRDPDYLTAQRTELRKRPFSFDGVGLSLLVIAVVCWEVMLSKGQEWDWLGDPFWRVQTLAILFAAGLAGLIFWELRSPNPVVNFRPLGERNFAACCVIIFCAYAVLYGASTSLPGLLQSLFGYNALQAGVVMSPAGFFCRPYNARRGPCAWPADRCAVGDYGRPVGHGGRELLDVTAQSRHQPGAGSLAPGRSDRRIGHMFCTRKCRCPPLYAERVARSRCRLVESAT